MPNRFFLIVNAFIRLLIQMLAIIEQMGMVFFTWCAICVCGGMLLVQNEIVECIFYKIERIFVFVNLKLMKSSFSSQILKPIFCH